MFWLLTFDYLTLLSRLLFHETGELTSVYLLRLENSLDIKQVKENHRNAKSMCCFRLLECEYLLFVSVLCRIFVFFSGTFIGTKTAK